MEEPPLGDVISARGLRAKARASCYIKANLVIRLVVAGLGWRILVGSAGYARRLLNDTKMDARVGKILTKWLPKSIQHRGFWNAQGQQT